jgi:hypothetical protein
MAIGDGSASSLWPRGGLAIIGRLFFFLKKKKKKKIILGIFVFGVIVLREY